MSRISGLAARLTLALALFAIVGWPAIATVREAARASASTSGGLPATGALLDQGWFRDDTPKKVAGCPGRYGSRSRPPRWSPLTEMIALPLGIALAFFLFRTDYVGPRPAARRDRPVGIRATAVACNGLAGCARERRPRSGFRHPAPPGRLPGAAFVHAMAALPWVVLIVAVGLTAVEPELEESALLDHGRGRVLLRVTLRRASARLPRRPWRSPF